MSTPVSSARLFVRHSLLLRALSERLHDVEHDDAVGGRYGGEGGTEQTPRGLGFEVCLCNVLGAEVDDDGRGEHQRRVEKEAPEGIGSVKISHLPAFEFISHKLKLKCTSFLPVDS